jgi:hypothetical protein
MPEIPPLPELPPKDERPHWAESLLAVDASLRQSVHELREENQTLRDEIARLKNQKPKPPIQPSRLSEGSKKKRRGKREGKADQACRIDRTVVVKAADVPKGSRFKGYDDYVVQELLITAQTTRYRAEKWLTPEGKLVTGELPVDKTRGHFGPTLTSFVLYQYYHAQVTEPLILEALHEWGVRISSGQLHRLLVEGKQAFHQEKDEILRVGLQASGHIHADDTGTRHQGKNGYCTHIGNEWFAWFQSTESKSRINFLQLLRAGHTDYALNGEALEYMAAQHLPAQPLARLAAANDKAFADAPQWRDFLRASGVTADRHVRIATEGALLGAAFAHGLNPQLAIVSDDAGQFNVLCHALCWIHAERVLAKLVGFNDAQRADLDRVRTLMWRLYRDIQHYQAAPTEAAKENLKARLCVQRRLACSAGDKPAGVKVRNSVAWIAGWRETKTLKPIDKAFLGKVASHRAVMKMNAEVASKMKRSESRARNREGEGSMTSRNLTDAITSLRRGGSDGTLMRAC